jgi:peptidoglycan hydrolase-like protein with peptidoglycan-binding domain
VSDKHFLVEDQDIHDEVIVLGPSGPHKVEELERDLLAVRHHYHELGQRASALASERDAVAARLSSARADAESARRQLEQLRAQRDAGSAALEQRLQFQQGELEEQRRQRQHLEARLAQTEQRIEALRNQYEQERQARDSEHVAQLDALGEQLTAAGQENARLQAQHKALASELEQAQKVSTAAQDAAGEQIGALDRRFAQLETEHRKALETARALEASLTAAAEQQHSTEARLARLEQERNTLASELEQARTASATEQDAAREQIAAREQRIAELETEHASSLQRARELETSLTAAAERQRSAEQRVTELEQTLREERSTLEAELGDTRDELTRARAEQAQARSEQARLTETLRSVERQLAETERRDQAAREDAEARIVAAETAQRTLGEKVRQLAEQLHQQHQQQDRLEQQARDHRAEKNKVRAEFERKSSELQAEVVRLQQELEHQRSAASPPRQQQTREPGSPQDDSSGGPNSWKMVAGASLLLGSLASATTYWNTARVGQNSVLADASTRGPAGHSSAISIADPLETPAVDPFTPLPLPAADAEQLPVRSGPVQGPIAAAISTGASRHSGDPGTDTATPGGAGQARSTSVDGGIETSATLQSTARASLRALDDPLAISSLELQGNRSIQEQQNDLIALGFDLGEARADGFKGKRTRQALSEFQHYYLPVTGLPEAVDDQHLASVVNVFADIARNDQEAFGIDGDVLAAIRLGSLRTGMDFPYLMELAYTESSFNPAKKARRSSAAGLYQFTDGTWLDSIKAYGEKYGLGLYASAIEYVTDHKGRRRPTVANPIVYRHILALRYNPRIATLLAAEFALKNKQRLTRSLGPAFGRTELYLTHFFGIEDALKFLRLLEQHPDRVAAELFPTAAQSNPGVFEPLEGQKATMQQVYDFFDAKFDTGRYEILNPALALVQEIRP